MYQETRDENQTTERRWKKKKRENFLIEEFILMSQNRISFHGRQDCTGPVQRHQNKKWKFEEEKKWEREKNSQRNDNMWLWSFPCNILYISIKFLQLMCSRQQPVHTVHTQTTTTTTKVSVLNACLSWRITK